MALYTVMQNYRSGIGSYAEGDQVELADELAEHINRDAPGTLEPVIDEPEPEPVAPGTQNEENGSEEQDSEESEEEGEGEERESEDAGDESEKERQVDAPPRDRMVKGARRRDRQGDPSDQGAITKDDFKAMKDGD